ncbi:MAG TPA: hypothetical protein VM030_07440 [Acidimicrobiales bacterium]|nr:hypothetical protein [Acidimicrobiales bacterium]
MRRVAVAVAVVVAGLTVPGTVAVAKNTDDRTVTPRHELVVPVDSAAGEVLIAFEARAPGTSWAKAGRESTVLAVSIDAGPVSHLVVTGNEWQPHRALLGAVAAGRHRVVIEVAPSLSPVPGPVQVRRTEVRVMPPGGPAGVVTRHAPMLFGRSLPDHGGPGQNATTDTPLLAFHTISPATGEGHRVIEYSLVWSNEDGGTDTTALMARWGRSTDIEWAYRLEVDERGAAVPGTQVFQGPDHAVTRFAGTYEGSHPRLQTCTANNNLCDRVVDGALRFFLDPVTALPAGRAREWVMDTQPWTYARMAHELIREGKLEQRADPATDAVSDPANYLYVEIDRDTSPPQAAPYAGLAVEVKLRNGRTYTSHKAQPAWTIQRDEPAATAVELPPGTTAADVLELVARRVPVYPVDPIATVTVTDVRRVFLLGRDHRPGPSFASFRGSAALDLLHPSASLWRRA